MIREVIESFLDVKVVSFISDKHIFVVFVSLSFIKTLMCSGKSSPFLTEGSNQDSVALIMPGLYSLFSTSKSAALFLMLWQFIKMHRKFDILFCLYDFLLLVVLLLIVSFEL